jgi:hypothetical protein
MTDHKCLIGYIIDWDNSDFFTLDDLEKHIEDKKQFNQYAKNEGLNNLLYKEYTLADYADMRKRTDIIRFRYCPDCGKKIDWAGIRRASND